MTRQILRILASLRLLRVFQSLLLIAILFLMVFNDGRHL